MRGPGVVGGGAEGAERLRASEKEPLTASAGAEANSPRSRPKRSEVPIRIPSVPR